MPHGQPSRPFTFLLTVSRRRPDSFRRATWSSWLSETRTERNTMTTHVHGTEAVRELYLEWTANRIRGLQSDTEAWGDLTAEPRGVDYTETQAAGLPALWAVPVDCAQDRVLLCMHGGGFVGGSIYSHRKLFAHLAKAAGARALVFEYRLAPENIHPAPVEDALTAYRWLLDQGIDSGARSVRRRLLGRWLGADSAAARSPGGPVPPGRRAADLALGGHATVWGVLQVELGHRSVLLQGARRRARRHVPGPGRARNRSAGQPALRGPNRSGSDIHSGRWRRDAAR